MSTQIENARKLGFGPRRAVYVEVTDRLATDPPIDRPMIEHLETFDRIYRALCSLMFNYVPTSGHPGGSISSGRIVSSLLFGGMDYDLADPVRDDADLISYAAGHKALGLYAMWALRNEVARIAAPELLPEDRKLQLRLEDLLGFRRNPTTKTPLFMLNDAKPLDGHPTPATPFIKIATGASGVGLPASIGLAWAAADVYGKNAPRVHIIEGEGGMTPGRVAEAMAAAGTASMDNVVLHVDWNQASIDSDHVCRDGETPGEYVQWNPVELAYLHDWNVVLVDDGFDFAQVAVAQKVAAELTTGQPTAIVYRTVKGWRYGITGRASHGAGHPMCSDGFFQAVAPLMTDGLHVFPRCDHGPRRCGSGADATIVEECYWEAIGVVRRSLEENREVTEHLASRLKKARSRLNKRARHARPGAPKIDAMFAAAHRVNQAALGRAIADGDDTPTAPALVAGNKTTLRDALGLSLNAYNRVGGGAIVAAAADLLGSTSVNKVADGFPKGFFHRHDNPESRTLAIGGICEDAMAAMLSGIASFGHHSGAGSSYGAFNAALGHIAARLHCIGNQARQAIDESPYRPFFLVCAHAGLKTGEDGPTHADPQALQLLQENFPNGTMMTLTPWDPNELWFVVSAALDRRPAVIAPFVTRPPETVLDRESLGLAPASAAAAGVYKLRSARGKRDAVVVLQGSAVAYAFVQGALPLLEREGIDVEAYYVSSAELFDALPEQERGEIFPESVALEAMGITDFTLPTLYRWVRSERGLAASLHPFRKGHYLGSGSGPTVLAEAGLDGESQFKAIAAFARA